ncbi:tetratricopeptide repeat protein [Sandarakinorhabdus sp.]|uniref:tetratricopeptide repeat protein n=1 Tax=Sandarakinorhabdus sp. TaxID=1916663 RepID=UPI00286DE584|nr:tetratricopeptide repeat protein [Sandarakinorhabdus sp.]
MAKPPANSPASPDEAFLREVDEEVRRDQILSIWQRYGKFGVALLLLALGALGGWLWWQDQQAKGRGLAGEQLTQAMTQLEVGEGARARPVLTELAGNGSGAYPGLARMTLANDLVAGGNTAKAIALYDLVAADTAQPQPLRDAALVKSVRLGFDTLAPAAVIARLKPLAVPGNPWFGLAGEMTALSHLKAGQADAARPLLVAIVKDESLPPSLRGRVAQLALAQGIDSATLGMERAPASPAAPR